jgi:trigger factor
MPTIQRTDIDSATAHITVTITGDELKTKVDAALKELQKKAQIKGFRTGHAPMQYVRSMYGQPALSDAYQNLMTDGLFDFIKEQNLRVLGQPLPSEEQEAQDIPKIGKLQDEYKFVYEVGHVPAFTVAGLDKTKTLERMVPSDMAALIEKEMDSARERAGGNEEVESPIETEDIVQINIQELTDETGDIKPEGWTTEVKIPMFSVSDETKAIFTGKAKGDKVRLNMYEAEGSGRTREFVRRYLLNIDPADERETGEWFEAEITAVLRKGKAAINEEFLKAQFGEEVTDEAAANEMLAKYIKQSFEYRTNNVLYRDIIKHLIEVNNFALPEAFLKRWLIISGTMKDMGIKDFNRDFPKFTDDLRWSIIRDKLVEEYDIFVSDDDLQRHFANQIRSYLSYDLGAEFINNFAKRMMEDKKQVEEATRAIEGDRLFDVLLPGINIEEVPTPSEAINQMLKDASAQAAAAEEETEAVAELAETTEV